MPILILIRADPLTLKRSFLRLNITHAVLSYYSIRVLCSQMRHSRTAGRPVLKGQKAREKDDRVLNYYRR